MSASQMMSTSCSLLELRAAVEVWLATSLCCPSCLPSPRLLLDWWLSPEWFRYVYLLYDSLCTVSDCTLVQESVPSAGLDQEWIWQLIRYVSLLYNSLCTLLTVPCSGICPQCPRSDQDWIWQLIRFVSGLYNCLCTVLYCSGACPQCCGTGASDGGKCLYNSTVLQHVPTVFSSSSSVSPLCPASPREDCWLSRKLIRFVSWC